MVEFQRAANLAEIAKEKAKEERAHENVKKIKAIQYADAIANQRKLVGARVIELEQDKLLREIAAQDDDKFSEICIAEIKRYAAAGKPVYTLMRALEATQPQLIAAKTVKVAKRGGAGETGEKK